MQPRGKGIGEREAKAHERLDEMPLRAAGAQGAGTGDTGKAAGVRLANPLRNEDFILKMFDS